MMEKDSHPPAYPPQAPHGYPPPQPVGYPAPQPVGYPAPQPVGYPAPQSAGYPPPQPAGYPPPQTAGYPAGPPMQQGYQPQIQGPPQPETQQPGFPPQQYGYPPVQQQPGSFQQLQPGPSQPSGWMVPPSSVPSDCPPGLEYLTQIDQLLIKQQIEVLEIITGFETNNKYKVQNSLGQQVYFASEDTDCCTRNICGPSRPFDINIQDNSNREVIHLTRPLRCSACCFPCCLQELEVQSPPGTVIGYVEQNWSICIPRFAITTPTHETVLQIEGPFFQCNMCGDVEYKVLSADGETEVGKISKQWSGLLKEAFTDADNFGISFPMDLDVKVKATVLGAAFLIDFMFFEEAANNNNNQY